MDDDQVALLDSFCINQSDIDILKECADAWRDSGRSDRIKIAGDAYAKIKLLYPDLATEDMKKKKEVRAVASSKQIANAFLGRWVLVPYVWKKEGVPR